MKKEGQLKIGAVSNKTKFTRGSWLTRVGGAFRCIRELNIYEIHLQLLLGLDTNQQR